MACALLAQFVWQIEGPWATADTALVQRMKWFVQYPLLVMVGYFQAWGTVGTIIGSMALLLSASCAFVCQRKTSIIISNLLTGAFLILGTVLMSLSAMTESP